MKKLFFVFALSFSTLTAIDSHSQIISNYEKETVVTFTIRAKHPNAKKSVAMMVESIFGISFQSAMKMLNQGNPIVIVYKDAEKEQPGIKSALEAAGAEVEVK